MPDTIRSQQPERLVAAAGRCGGLQSAEIADHIQREKLQPWASLWSGSWCGVFFHTRTSGGSGAPLLVDQCLPRHRLKLLEEVVAHLRHARIRGASRIQRVQDPAYEGLERLARHRRHERDVRSGLLGRARLRMPVLRQVFPVVRLQRAPVVSL